MRVALVHDDLVQWGGAERVLLGLCEIFPDAPIFTSVYDQENLQLKKLFGEKKIITSFMQEIPGWKHLYKTLLPIYPYAFEQFDFSQYDLVISHTTRFAKAILTKPQTKHICYCHTPPRFLWHFSENKNFGFGEILMTKLRVYDVVSVKRVDKFIAGSENARKRIKKFYNVDSIVVYPFIDTTRFESIEGFDGGYYLIVGRVNSYKKYDLAIKACSALKTPLRMIDGKLEDQNVIRLIAGCKAVIIPGIEDFGLVSLEAQALGKPVIAFAKGGALETIIPGKTGILFMEQTTNSLCDAILKLDSIKIDENKCRENASNFSKEIFISKFKASIATLL